MTHRSVRLEVKWKAACSEIDLQRKPSRHVNAPSWRVNVIDAMFNDHVPSHDVDIDGVARYGEGDVACHDEHEHPPVGGLSASAEE